MSMAVSGVDVVAGVLVFEGAQDVLGCQWFRSLPTRGPTGEVPE